MKPYKIYWSILKLKISILFWSLVLCLISCQSSKTNAKHTDFNLGVCRATYQEKELPFEKPIEEWKALFGESPRFIQENAGYKYTWDELGIYLKKFYDESYPNGFFGPDELYVFFENLEHPVAQAGEFEFARGRKSLKYVENEMKEAKLDFQEENREFIQNLNKNGDGAPKNYPYPTGSVYKDTLLVDGVTLYRGITLKEYNKQRALVEGAGKVGYWDRDMNLINERGSTLVKTGEFSEIITRSLKESSCAKTDNYYFLITYRFTEEVLEYIKIQKVEKGKSFYWQD